MLCCFCLQLEIESRRFREAAQLLAFVFLVSADLGGSRYRVVWYRVQRCIAPLRLLSCRSVVRPPRSELRVASRRAIHVSSSGFPRLCVNSTASCCACMRSLVSSSFRPRSSDLSSQRGSAQARRAHGTICISTVAECILRGCQERSHRGDVRPPRGDHVSAPLH